MQVVDLVVAADKDTQEPLQALRVDGGMAANAWFLQCQANLLGKPVEVSLEKEATALGAALLAGLKAGIWPDLDALGKLAQTSQRFEPTWDDARRGAKLAQWHRAVRAAISFYSS